MNGERGGREAPSLLFNNIVKTAVIVEFNIYSENNHTNCLVLSQRIKFVI